MSKFLASFRLFSSIIILLFIAHFQFITTCLAHPLGNFTINHFSRIQVGSNGVTIKYVLDMAEIPTFQERAVIDQNSDGNLSQQELDQYAEKLATELSKNLHLIIDGTEIVLSHSRPQLSLPAGAGGLSTLRLECELEGLLPTSSNITRQLSYQDQNHATRLGWQEIVVAARSGLQIFNSTAYGNSLSKELTSYPEGMIMAPLNEREATFSITSGAVPAGAKLLLTREGQQVAQTRDRFMELISVPQLTPGVALLGLLLAMLLGGLHALSPGHGKTIVGAYLIGSRGTLRHALFLGLTVTVTHTIGVFALGLITLYASQYILPERLFPILSMVSGLIVVGIGINLFIQRLTSIYGFQHSHSDGSQHSHGIGLGSHSHLPPGADNGPITWRGLLGVGISGGLLPCPSALVVLLSAISLQRVGYGLLLVVMFSVGLAAVLAGIGLLFVYTRSFFSNSLNEQSNLIVRWLPTLSALVISIIGVAICYEAFQQPGTRELIALLTRPPDPAQAGWLSIVTLLGFGFVLGLKHAIEADHVAAVTTIVSESRSLFGASIVGAVWGVGHTISLLIAGVAMILLQVQISEKKALALEFMVGIMLTVLGALAIFKLVRGGSAQLTQPAIKPKTDEKTSENGAQLLNRATNLNFSLKPLLVGMMHGLAGSAALLLLVVTTTSSALLSLAYIIIFGIGSIAGMLLMSMLVGLPVHFTAQHFTRINIAVRSLAGLFSLFIGLSMVYEIGYVEKLFQ